jgi:hypothetical protein
MVFRVRILAVLAALGLTLSATGASAAPAAQASPEAATGASSHGAKSTFVLIKSHGGGSVGGGGMSRGMGSGMGRSSMGPRMGGSMGPRMGTRGPGMRAMRMNGRVGYGGGWRHRRHGRGIFVYGDGYGYDGYDDYGGGSCYWNCRRSGYGPGYCRAYASNFCD